MKVEKGESNKTPASLREFRLPITDKKGAPFSSKVMAEIRKEKKLFDSLQAGESVPEDITFRVNKRGVKYDHLRMAIDIMEAPPPGKQGISRKDAKRLDSLLDKLYEAESEDESGNRPESVLLDEGEWKDLRDRVDSFDFPNRNRATRRFQESVCEETEKVPVAKAT